MAGAAVAHHGARCQTTPLSHIVSVGELNGARAWRTWVGRYDPAQATMAAGQLRGTPSFSFGGGVEARAETFEREAFKYAQRSTEKVPHANRVGTVV